jgi:hypothetical protein
MHYGAVMVIRMTGIFQLIIVLILSLQSQRVFAQNFNLSIRVVEQTSSGLSPVNGAEVALLGNGPTLKTTNNLGLAEFGNFPAGPYILVIRYGSGSVDYDYDFSLNQSGVQTVIFNGGSGSIPALSAYNSESECENANAGWECDPQVINGVTQYVVSRPVSPPTSTPTPTPSPPSTALDNRLPPATEIIDSAGARWTIRASDKAILKNGVQFNGAYGLQVLYYQGSIYYQATNTYWYKWTGTAWWGAGPNDPSPSTLGRTPTPTPTPTPVPDRPALGSLDLADNTAFAGWAADPDITGSVNVHIYVDGVFYTAVLANLSRSDVGAHAFHVPHNPLPSGTHRVDAFAIGVKTDGTVSGSNPPLQLSGRTFSTVAAPSTSGTRVPPAAEIIDSAGAKWTIRSDYAILKNGSHAAAAYGVGVQILYYQTAIYVKATNGYWYKWMGTEWWGLTMNDPAGPTPAPDRPATGTLDLADNTAFAGWASDPDITGPVNVHIYVNGVFYTAVLANATRSDVGAHAFHAPHNPLPAGTYKVDAYAIGVKAGGALSGSNPPLANTGRTFTVVASTGNRVPPATQVTDSAGAVWTLRSSDKAILKNGVQMGGAYGLQILYYQSAIYYQAKNTYWYKWTGTAWWGIGATDPSGSSTPTPTPTPTPPPPVDSAATGTLDLADNASFGGWAKDIDAGGPINVHIYVDGVMYTSALANITRTDVGPYAFSLSHAPFAPGSHRVDAYAIGIKPGGALSGSNPALLGSGIIVTVAVPTATLSVTSTGLGTVTSTDGRLNCGTTCSAVYNQGTGVSLTAIPATGYLFNGWTGAADCSNGHVTMDVSKSCSAAFVPAPGNISDLPPVSVSLAAAFDEAFYLATYSDVAGAVKAGSFPSGWYHYSIAGGREGRMPNSWFREDLYRAYNPDVVPYIGGTFASGFDHYLKAGAREGRKVLPEFDERAYVARYYDVYQALKNNGYYWISGLMHYQLGGKNEGRYGGP